jgi:hypothetical protein
MRVRHIPLSVFCFALLRPARRNQLRCVNPDAS